MTDQTTSADSWTSPPDTGRHRSESERPASRAIGAALVAGGLALSVSLYPLPDGPHPLDALTADGGSSWASPNMDDSIIVKYSFADMPALRLTELVKLVKLTNDFPDLAAGDLWKLVTTYGLSDVVKALEVVNSFGPLRPYFPHSWGGVGGGGGGSEGFGNVLPAVVIVLEYLKLHPPAMSGLGLLNVVTSVYSTLAESLGISRTVSGPPLDAQTWALAAAAELTTMGASVSMPPDPSTVVSTGTLAPASADGPVSAPIEPPAEPPVTEVLEAPALALVHPPVIATIELPAPVTAELSSTPEPTSVAPQETNPPTSSASDPGGSDPPTSSGSGSTGGTSTDSSGGSSTGSSGGTSTDSSGGSSTGSSGGSSTGSSGGSSTGSSGGSSTGSSGGSSTGSSGGSSTGSGGSSSSDSGGSSSGSE